MLTKSKILILFALFITIVPLSFCQTVDSIKIEQAGDLIKIKYKILNSNQYQLFRVTVFCSINGGLKSELRSLWGDFGENVPGGISEYIVLWDVLKDVDEVNSVDFFVRTELIKDNTPNSILKKPLNWSDTKFYFIPTLHEGHGIFYGLRLAYIKSFGITGKYTAGYYHDHDLGSTFAFHSSLDLTKRIINIRGFQMNLIAGIAYAKESFGPMNDAQYYNNFLGFELGTIIGIGRFVISIAGEFFNPKLDQLYVLTHNNYTNIGFGLRF